MSGYAGRHNQGLLSRNFGGISNDTSIVNIGDNQAYVSVNWDIGQKGTIKRRKGWVQLTTIGDYAQPKAIALWVFPDAAGVSRWAAVAYNAAGALTMWEAAAPGGPWTAASGSVVFTETDPEKYFGIPWKGKLFVVNGTDAPTMLIYGYSHETLKNASILQTPSSLSCYRVGTLPLYAAFTGYGVCAKTPIGRTPLITVETERVGANWYTNLNIDSVSTPTTYLDGVSRYFVLAWNPVASCSGYEIYAFSRAAYSLQEGRGNANQTGYLKLADVNYGTNTWSDPGGGFHSSMQSGPTINTSYNTPNWETSGYPTGGCIVSKGREERLLLWRGSTVWGSSLADPLDWWSAGNAMVFAVTGSGDVEIVAGNSLYDYLMLFSKTGCWVYSGAGSQSMSLEKNIPVGCAGKNATIQVGTDMYLFSQFGPTTFNRIMAGADIKAAHEWADRVKTTLFTETNVQDWSRIFAYNDIKNSRVVWTIPKVGQTVNGMAVVYQYDCDAFTTYDSFGFTHIVQDNYLHYGLTEGSTNAIAQIGVGNTDNGESITATYKTGWFDYRTWDMQKRMVFVDVIASTVGGAYSFSVSWSWDYDRQTGGPKVCTETSTDGATIQRTSALSTEHRVYTSGLGNAVQLVFETSAGDEEVEILGWRPDVRSKGLRRSS